MAMTAGASEVWRLSAATSGGTAPSRTLQQQEEGERQRL